MPGYSLIAGHSCCL